MFTHRRGIALVVSNFQLPLPEASEHTANKNTRYGAHHSQAQAPTIHTNTFNHIHTPTPACACLLCVFVSCVV